MVRSRFATGAWIIVLLTLLVNSLSIGSVYALIALSYSLIFSTSSLLNFALGDVVTIGAFVGITVFYSVSSSFPLAAVAAVLTSALVCLLMERFLLRSMIRTGASSLGLLIVTLGVSIVLRNAALRVWGPEAHVLPSILGGTYYQLGSFRVDPQYLFIFVAGVSLMAALHLFLSFTRPGRAMRAVAQDRRAASLMGVDVNGFVALSFALSGAVAGAAGILMAPILFITASMGSVIGLKGFVAAVVGGLGNLQGAIAGGLLLAIVEALGAGVLRSGYRDAVAFAVLILVLWLRPGGVLSRHTAEKV
jgi:branched-chain amino acid transport system permease protein